nr:hypothetical protein [Planctomycetota bacterium]
VIAEAVRQMQAQQELRAEVQLGIDSLDRGEGIILNGDDELRGYLEKIKEDGRTQLAANETGPAE